MHNLENNRYMIFGEIIILFIIFNVFIINLTVILYFFNNIEFK